MICTDCKTRSHAECIQRNVDKRPADCDCQHRVEQATIVLPVEGLPVEVLTIKVLE